MHRTKHMFFLGLLFILVLTLLPLTSTVGAIELPTPREETLVLDVIGYEVTVWDSFNPFIWAYEFCAGWVQVCHEWDWYKTSVGEPKLWKVTGWEYSDNYTTFTLHIREGVHWNDGHPYTSRDIAFTINMIKDQTSWLGSDVYNEWIDSVETPDDYTLVVHLKKPHTRFADTFGMWMSGICPYWWPWVVPEHIWKDVDPNTFTNNPPVGTGPYKLKEANPTLRYQLWERDENYWAKDLFSGFEQSPRYVMFKETGPIDVQVAEFVNGESDLLRPTPGYDIMRMLPDLSPTIILVPGRGEGGAEGLGVNTGKYPWTLREFRWALSYCIDRERIARLDPNAPPGYTVPVTSGIPCGYSIPAATSAELQRYIDVIKENNRQIEEEYGWKIEYDLDKAAEILDSLDFIDRDGDGIRETTNGTKLSFEILATVPDQEWQYKIIIDDAAKVGIHIDVVPSVDFWWRLYVYPGKYDLHLTGIGYGGGTTFDVAKTLDTYHSVRGAGGYACWGQPDYGGKHWSNPRYDELVDEMMSVPPDDYETIDPLAEEALYLLGLDMPQIPITQSKGPIFTANTAYWKGWPTAANYYTELKCWFGTFFYLVLNLKPATSVELTYLTVFATTDLPEFTAADGGTYGPFIQGEAATVPEQDAESLILAGKASYTAPVAPEISEVADAATRNKAAMDALGILMGNMNSTMADLSEDVSSTYQSVEALSGQVSTLTSQTSVAAVEALSGQVSTLTSVAIVEGVAIVVVAVLAVLLRRKPT